MMKTYVNQRTGQKMTKQEVKNEAKLINLYNQVYGTSYDTTSIGIQTVVRKRGFSGRSLDTGFNNRNFAHYRRTGTAFNELKNNQLGFAR